MRHRERALVTSLGVSRRFLSSSGTWLLVRFLSPLFSPLLASLFSLRRFLSNIALLTSATSDMRPQVRTQRLSAARSLHRSVV